MDKGIKKLILKELEDKESREFFVRDSIDEGLSFQIIALRKQFGWSQKELAKRSKLSIKIIKELEDPNISNNEFDFFVKVANAFDIVLSVRFVSFKEEIELLDNLSLEVDPYEERFFKMEKKIKEAKRIISIVSKEKNIKVEIKDIINSLEEECLNLYIKVKSKNCSAYDIAEMFSEVEKRLSDSGIENVYLTPYV